MTLPPPDSAPAAEPLYRPSARIILLDPADRILLLKVRDDAGVLDEPELWITPGGGVEPGETLEEAALRELWEETGLREADLGPKVWRRRHVWRWGRSVIDSDEHFFLVRTQDTNVAPLKLDHLVEAFHDVRWWSVEEIRAASHERFVPRALADLLEPLLAGDLPPEPLTVGV